MDVRTSFLDILQVLLRHRVDFFVVGGVAAILQAVPISTFDLDIMAHPTADNRERLLAALRELNARYFDPAGRHILPDAEKLETLRHHRLLTSSGPLDVMERIGHDLTWEDLVDHTRQVKLDDAAIRVLDLEMIIRSKEQANRDKDQAALPALRRSLELRRHSPEEN